MRVRLRHETVYAFGEPSLLGPHVVRLRPATHARALLLSYNLDVRPDAEVRWQHDPWGNRVARVSFEDGQRIEELRLVVDAAFDVRPVNPFDFFVDDRCHQLPFPYPDGLDHELAPFLSNRAPSPRLERFLEDVPKAGYITDWLVDLNRRVAERVRYVIRAEAGIQTSEQTLEIGSGSCRDSAVLLVDVLRARGLAARFVSGYLVQLADEGIIPDVAKGVSQDVVDLHAWAEVYLPGAGWIGLDGTSGLFAGEGHVPLASAVNPELAAPVSGTAERPAARFEATMSVVRLGHEPRPRVPYADEVWREMLAAGEAIDRAIVSEGMTLTVGGEPTWTSREHPAAPEWNTEAIGETKLAQGHRLARELLGRFGVGPLVVEQTGKQYPGESLPRWALNVLWRNDDVPVWNDRSRLAFVATGGALIRDHGAAVDAARALAVAIGTRLGLDPSPIDAYEDPWLAIIEEQGYPVDVDPLKANLDDPEERRRLARVLARGLGRPVGVALPLRREDGQWRTGPWTFRRGHLHLVPGDSPMGLRLPLARIGGEPDPFTIEDVTTATGPLVDPRERVVIKPQVPGARAERTDAKPRPGARRALCVEPRGGVLHVFLPPVASADDFFDLVAAVEGAVVERDLRVRIEGYPPPSDHRVASCLVTPDPGVIEVNLPVSRTFAEYVELVQTVNDAANHAGLTTEKFQLDGRVAGSGGGNHLTFGGPSPAESPFLRHPDLLGSLLRYLQNHPALSFLFTGLFVGPTSQAPRVDEARHDALAELELALAQIPKRSGTAPPWLIDRLLRNLLTDVSGNTHRTEVSIDKLFDPSGPAGRQGLVELRAFEMPPHERMAAAQVLLVRGLFARFAKAPYEEALVRWGTQIHDRFMLPTYLWSDLEDVAADLRAFDVPIDAEWFRPFLEFRCPRVGHHQLGQIELELRSALEPWITLGEQPVGSVVARYVDSSLERLEVKVRGLVPGRHVVAVNGVEVPLRATGVADEGVAGVRFRAWQPPFCLQPNIAIQHPLRFDVIDRWARRSLGACAYHVWHPEGRAFEEPPLTAFEAAARRAQRFTTEGHAPWPATVRPTRPHPEHPYTLDLRLHTVGLG